MSFIYSFISWLRPWIPYEYWDLSSLFLEQTIILERLKERELELVDCRDRMMEFKTSEYISEYNIKKDAVRKEKATLDQIESLINPKLM